MKIQKFEDIIAWQKAQDLAVVIYKSFNNSRDFGFKDQIQRASVSISNNIAQASCSEVKSMVYLANRLNYLDKKTTNQFVENTNEIGRIIRGLIKSLTTNFN